MNDVYAVVYDEFPVPCSHPSCALIHRRFFEGGEKSWEWVALPGGGEQRVQVTGSHEVMRSQWLVLRNGERADDLDPQDRKRDALALVAQLESRS